MRTLRAVVDIDNEDCDITEVVDVIADSDDDGVTPHHTRSGVPPLRFHGYRRGRELGRGASGRVFVCSKKGHAGGFAVKAVDLRRMQLSSNVEFEHKALCREVEILKRLPPHPSIVQLVDSFEEGEWFLLVLELVSGGDLFTILTSREPPRFLEREAAYVLKQLGDGLTFLHGQGVIHRDLKLENVLVASESRRRGLHLYNVKITDFGLSKSVGIGMSEAYSVVGTHPYTAPEVLSGGSYDFSSDLWCLGVLMFVLLVGHYPFDSVCADQNEIDNLAGKIECGDLAKSVICGLLHLDSTLRLTLDQICSHEWLHQWNDDTDCEPQGKRRCLSIEIPEEEIAASSIIEDLDAVVEHTLSQKGVEPIMQADGSETESTQHVRQASGVGEWLAYIYSCSRGTPSSAAAAALCDVCPTCSQPNEMLVHMGVPERFVGAVTGASLLMKQIATTVGCSVRWKSHEGMSCQLLIITGSFQQCAIVQELVNGRLRDAFLTEGKDVAELAEVVLFVRAEAAGMITGKQGFVLKQIRKQSGAKIQLLREQVKGHRPCILSGSLQHVLHAERHVFDLVRAVPVVKTVVTAAESNVASQNSLADTPPVVTTSS